MSSLRSAFFLFLLFALASCNNTEESAATQTKVTEEITQSVTEKNLSGEATPQMPSASTNVQVKVFKNASAEHPEGYGYDILMEGRLYIHQAQVPAIPGNKGFATESDAMKTGELMAFKIRNNIMPPSITIEELDSLGVNIK